MYGFSFNIKTEGEGTVVGSVVSSYYAESMSYTSEVYPLIVF